MSLLTWGALIVFAGGVGALIAYFENSTSRRGAKDPAEAAERQKTRDAAYEYRVYRDLVWRGYAKEEARRIARERVYGTSENGDPDPGDGNCIKGE